MSPAPVRLAADLNPYPTELAMSAILTGLLVSGLLALFLAVGCIMFLVIQVVFKDDHELAKLRDKMEERSDY